MRKAIIHIGVEKTGSTSIQNFLYKNESLLKNGRILFPFQSVGLLSNHKIVNYIKDEVDPSLMRLSGINDVSGLNINEWKADFLLTHKKELGEFFEGDNRSTVVYSSEHLHSRIRTREEVSRFKEFLDEHYDRCTVYIYIRRQDQIAVSAHNTAVQSGKVDRLCLDQIPGSARYYDFLALANLWASVFEKDSVKIKIFSRATLLDEDVVKDFISWTGIDSCEGLQMDSDRANEHLAPIAMEWLYLFNTLEDNHEMLNGCSKWEVRKKLLKKAAALKCTEKSDLPSRSSAINFYNKFKDSNEELLREWNIETAFSDDFSSYPIQAKVANASVEHSELRQVLDSL